MIKLKGKGLSRRDLLSSGTAIAGTAIFGSTVGAANPAPRKPNIVFIMADDMGAFDLSCYGREDYTTPNIDRLASEGLKFNLAYANSSSCTPTRVALISGRYQNRVPIGTAEGGGAPGPELGYEADWPSFPRMLKAAGYKTGLVGKWNLGDPPRFSPLKSGYDEFLGFLNGMIDYWTHETSGGPGQPGAKPDLYEGESLVSREGYSTDLFTDRACDFIRRNAAHPFLLSLHYNAPHSPWQSRTDRGIPREGFFHYDGGSPSIYADMVKAMDDGVGRVLDTLSRLGLDRDTLVIFTSDNGGERFSKMWPLRGTKGSLWEGGVRVPLLARWPGRIAQGSQTNQVTISMDWLPTLVALAGAKTDPTAPPDGIDIAPQLFGAAPVSRTLFWMTGEDRSALTYPWKYLYQNGREYLYDLSLDQTEHANLKRKEPETFARLKEMSETWAKQMLPPLMEKPPKDSEPMEALDPPPQML